MHSNDTNSAAGQRADLMVDLVLRKVGSMQQNKHNLAEAMTRFEDIKNMLDIRQPRESTEKILSAIKNYEDIRQRILDTSISSTPLFQSEASQYTNFIKTLHAKPRILADLYTVLADNLDEALSKISINTDKTRTVDEILVTVHEYHTVRRAIERKATLNSDIKRIVESLDLKCATLIQDIAKEDSILDAILDKAEQAIFITTQRALKEESNTLSDQERLLVSQQIMDIWTTEYQIDNPSQDDVNKIATRLEREDNKTFVDLLMTKTTELKRLIDTSTQKPIQDFLKKKAIPELKRIIQECPDDDDNTLTKLDFLINNAIKVLGFEVIKGLTILASSCEGPKISWKKSLEAIAKSLQPELQKAISWHKKIKDLVTHCNTLDSSHSDVSGYDSKLLCKFYAEIDNPDTFKTPIEALQAFLEIFVRSIESFEVPSEVMKNLLNRTGVVNENSFNKNPYSRIVGQSLIRLLQTLSKMSKNESSRIQTKAQSLIKELSKIKSKENPLATIILTVFNNIEKGFQQAIAEPKLYSLLETISEGQIHMAAFAANMAPICSKLNKWTLENIPAFEAEKSASANDPEHKIYELINRWNDKLSLWTPEQEKQRKTEVQNLTTELTLEDDEPSRNGIGLLEAWSKLYTEETKDHDARNYREALTRITQYAEKHGLSSHKLITDCLLAVTTAITAVLTLILSQKDLLDNLSMAVKSKGDSALEEFLFMPSTIIKFLECLSDGILSQQKLREKSKKSRKSIHRALRALSSSIKACIDIILTKLIEENKSFKEGTNSNLINFIAHISTYIREISFSYLSNTRIQRWFLALLRTFILTPFLFGYSAYRGNLLKDTPSIIKGGGKSLLYVISRGILHAPSILLFWIKFAWNTAKLMLISSFFIPKIIISQFGWKKPLLITIISALIIAAVSTATFLYFNVLCMILKAVSIVSCSGLLSYLITKTLLKQESTAKTVIGGVCLITGFYYKFLLTLSLSVSLLALPHAKKVFDIIRYNHMTKATVIACSTIVGLYFPVHPALIGCIIMMTMLVPTKKNQQKEKGKVALNSVKSESIRRPVNEGTRYPGEENDLLPEQVHSLTS